MVHIICGEKNQGKTCKIRSIYLEGRRGDGFIAKKIFRESAFCGYELVRLSTGETSVQSLRTELFPPEETPFLTCGSFSFHSEGFAFADSIVEEIIKNGTSPAYIDEIGPLELEGRGHCSCFRKVLDSGADIYCTVRNSCVDDVISYFNINSYSLIEL